MEVKVRDVPVCIPRRAETYRVREVHRIVADHARSYYMIFNGPSQNRDCLVRVSAEVTYFNALCPGGSWEVLEGDVTTIAQGRGVSTLSGRIIPAKDGSHNGWTPWVDALVRIAPGAKIRIRWGTRRTTTFVNNDGVMEKTEEFFPS